MVFSSRTFCSDASYIEEQWRLALLILRAGRVCVHGYVCVCMYISVCIHHCLLGFSPEALATQIPPCSRVSPGDFLFSFSLDFIYLFLERGEGREVQKERNINMQEIHPSVASHTAMTGDPVHNSGMHPDWESNP